MTKSGVMAVIRLERDRNGNYTGDIERYPDDPAELIQRPPRVDNIPIPKKKTLWNYYISAIEYLLHSIMNGFFFLFKESKASSTVVRYGHSRFRTFCSFFATALTSKAGSLIEQTKEWSIKNQRIQDLRNKCGALINEGQKKIDSWVQRMFDGILKLNRKDIALWLGFINQVAKMAMDKAAKTVTAYREKGFVTLSSGYRKHVSPRISRFRNIYAKKSESLKTILSRKKENSGSDTSGSQKESHSIAPEDIVVQESNGQQNLQDKVISEGQKGCRKYTFQLIQRMPGWKDLTNYRKRLHPESWARPFLKNRGIHIRKVPRSD